MATNKSNPARQLAKQAASAMTGIPVSKIGKGKHPAVGKAKPKPKRK